MEQRQRINSYRDLLVWKKGIALVKNTYQLTKKFPEDEKFGLVSQMRRATVSVPSNVAEGQARRGKREFVQFLSHAEGSLAELDTQVLVSIELGYCPVAEAPAAAVFDHRVAENGYITSSKDRPTSP